MNAAPWISCPSVLLGLILHGLLNLNMLYSFLPLLLVRPSNARLASVYQTIISSK